LNIKDRKLECLEPFLLMIRNENHSQLEKWGIQDRHIFEWAMWATEEFGEFIQAINEYNYERTTDISQIIKEGIQTITLILKILEGLE
jgi:hypothetical protein